MVWRPRSKLLLPAPVIPTQVAPLVAAACLQPVVHAFNSNSLFERLKQNRSADTRAAAGWRRDVCHEL